MTDTIKTWGARSVSRIPYWAATALLSLNVALVYAADATPLAYSSANGTKATLFEEKGDCVAGQIAVVDMGKGMVQGCWIERDGYVVIDLNTHVIAIYKIFFTVITKKVFS